MSINRVVNLTKFHRVVASNVSQKVPSTSNATKPNKQPPTITMSEIVKGNKGGGKRSMALVDEDEDEDEIFQGNRVDMEVDNVDQDDEYEDIDNTIHTNNQHEIQMPDHYYSEDEDTIQEQAIGAHKKVRGYTQKAEIWKMNSTERIIVTFNEFGKPVGEEGKQLVQYLGTLVRMADHVSIEYADWRKVPMQNKEDMYTLVKAMENDGVYPTRGEMYITIRTRKDESIVDDKAANAVASLKAIVSDSSSIPRDPNDFKYDEYSKVKGPEKRGYVRLVGRMPTTKSKGESSTNSQTIHQLQSAVNVMMNIIQEHIPNANLSTVLSNMNIQVPGIGSSAPNNSLSGNELSSLRSHDNDGRVDKM